MGTYRGAVELAGCDHHTVKHYAERRPAAAAATVPSPRTSLIDAYRPKIVELALRRWGAQ